MSDSAKVSEEGEVVTPPPAAERKRQPRAKTYTIDLRIHSPSSLGYLGIDGLDAAPALVTLAVTKGLDIIALTNAYSGSSLDDIKRAAAESHLVVVPGVDVRCSLNNSQELLLSCLFPDSFGSKEIDTFLNDLSVPQQHRGNIKYMLTLSLEELLVQVEGRGGMLLPTRMDKTPHRFQAIPRLVEEYGFRAFDLAYADTVRFFGTRWPKEQFHLFSFSNANALAQVGSRYEKVKLPAAGYAGLRELLQRKK